MFKHSKKGFTLIELLIVIAIIAILSVVVILTLNPAELLKQARDSNRVSDLSTLKSAISLYLSDVTSPNLASTTYGYNNCYQSPIQGNGPTASYCGNEYVTLSGTENVSTTAANNRKVDSTGWLPVNFTAISSGAPVGNLPVDPTNNATYYYSYAATGTSLTFEIDAYMESQKYASSSGSAIVGNDGGDHGSVYEVGTAPGLSL